MRPNEWCESVDELLDEVASLSDQRDVAPVVVLLGAYDTGKTSLLRRILVDQSEPVPEWARVTAREETSVVNSVEVLGCTMVDTPGLEGLSRWHASETRDALLNADAIVLLTTGSLFTSREDESGLYESLDAFAIASGRAFTNTGLGYPKRSLAILVALFDEFDPAEFPEDYERSREAKLTELASLLRRSATNAAYLGAVAADPFGRTRNRQTAPSDYDAYRVWDGMSQITDWISALPSRSVELRTWREVRRRAHTLTQRTEILGQALQEAVSAEADARAGHTDAVRVTARCSREREAAAARLQAALDRAIFAAPAPSEEHFRDELQRLLELELQRWADDVWRVLQGLAQEANTNLPDMVPGSASQAAEKLIRMAQQPAGWRQQTEAAHRGIKILNDALSALAVGQDEKQPSVREPGGLVATKWLSPRRAAALGVLLSASAELLGLAEQAGENRSQQVTYQRQRLTDEGGVVARLIFTSQASPDGWEALFDDLIVTARESDETWAALRSTAATRRAEIANALAATNGLQASRPEPDGSAPASCR